MGTSYVNGKLLNHIVVWKIAVKTCFSVLSTHINVLIIFIIHISHFHRHIARFQKQKHITEHKTAFFPVPGWDCLASTKNNRLKAYVPHQFYRIHACTVCCRHSKIFHWYRMPKGKPFTTSTEKMVLKHIKSILWAPWKTINAFSAPLTRVSAHALKQYHHFTISESQPFNGKLAIYYLIFISHLAARELTAWLAPSKK